jgi:hypothetical protein
MGDYRLPRRLGSQLEPAGGASGWLGRPWHFRRPRLARLRASASRVETGRAASCVRRRRRHQPSPGHLQRPRRRQRPADAGSPRSPARLVAGRKGARLRRVDGARPRGEGVFVANGRQRPPHRFLAPSRLAFLVARRGSHRVRPFPRRSCPCRAARRVGRACDRRTHGPASRLVGPALVAERAAGRLYRRPAGQRRPSIQVVHRRRKTRRGWSTGRRPPVRQVKDPSPCMAPACRVAVRWTRFVSAAVTPKP